MMILRTLDEMARYIGMSTGTVARYIDQGMPASRVGKAWITSTDLIDKWILSRHRADVTAKRELRTLRAMRRAATARLLAAPSEFRADKDLDMIARENPHGR